MNNKVSKLLDEIYAGKEFKLQPLDFVKTPKGYIALIVETNNDGKEVVLDYIDRNVNEKNAWWDASELVLINSLPYILSHWTKHPFGAGLDDVEVAFRRFK